MRLLSSSLLFLLPALVLADHLPERLMATGAPEHTLCGIDVYQTKAPALLARFGNPVSDAAYPKTEEARELVWNLSGTRIHATINVIGTAYAVDVTGQSGEPAHTGRGLALGQTLQDLKQLYGPAFRRRGNQITLQWHDGTEMRAKLSNNRIVSLTLIAQTE